MRMEFGLWSVVAKDTMSATGCGEGWEQSKRIGHQFLHSRSVPDAIKGVSAGASSKFAQQRFKVVACTLAQRRKAAIQEHLKNFHLCLCLVHVFSWTLMQLPWLRFVKSIVHPIRQNSCILQLNPQWSGRLFIQMSLHSVCLSSLVPQSSCDRLFSL